MSERDLAYRCDQVRYKPIPSGQLARWLGEEQVEDISKRMRGWYGPPIAVANVPGHVYACGDGDFAGKILCGHEANMQQWMLDDLRKKRKREQQRFGLISKQLGGFASLSDLISEATTGGKKQVLNYMKVGVAQPAVGSSASLFNAGIMPAAGAVAAVAPGGTVYTNATLGSLAQTNPTAGDTLHFVTWTGLTSAPQSTALVLVDNLFAVNVNHATLSTAVTGVPTRYQTAALAPGNFVSGNVTTVLGATAHNVTVTYVDNAGNAAETSAASIVRVSSAVNTMPMNQPGWFIPLNAGDTGLRNITNITHSAASTGLTDRMIAHPIAIMPGVGVANMPFILDGINSAFNLERIYDGAALGFFEWCKSSTAAATYTGQITLVSG